MVDAEEEALERAGRTIAVQVLQSPYHGPEHPIHELVPFDALAPIVRRPELAPNHGGWAPPCPEDYMSGKSDIKEAKNLYAEMRRIFA
jgi:hypothetical protein